MHGFVGVVKSTIHVRQTRVPPILNGLGAASVVFLFDAQPLSRLGGLCRQTGAERTGQEGDELGARQRLGNDLVPLG